MVRPITALLGEQGGGVWEARHTEALNAIAEVVYRRLKLGLVDMSRGVDVHMDADQHDCCAVMTQQEVSREVRVIAMMAHERSKTEQQGTLMERLLLCACWAIRRNAKYILAVPSREVVLPLQAEAECARLGSLPPRL